MGQHIDQFCDDLRLKLTNIESGLSSLKSKIDGKAGRSMISSSPPKRPSRTP